MTILPGTPIDSLEVAILDLLESLPASEEYKRKILDELRRIIGADRREQNITKYEMLYVHPAVARRRSASSR